MSTGVVSSISVVTPTYNSSKTLDQSLGSVRSQNYPQQKIEIILADGGSTDNTLDIAKRYNAKVIHIPPEEQHAEYNRGVAYNQATGEFVLILDHDNVLPYNDWLQDMLQPLLEHPEMVATETCYYDYNRSYRLLDRYYSLFGTVEPLPYYLGKADRMPQTAKKWVLSGDARDCGRYYLVKFDKDPRKIPSIGTNGCLLRRELVNRFANVSPEYHYPIDVMVDVIQAGHDQFGFVKNSIIHFTHAQGLVSFLTRRRTFVEHYYLRDHSKRRWMVVMPGDQMGVLKYVIYSMTFIKPSWDAFRGFVQLPDVAWFVHPMMCFGTTAMYGHAILKARLAGLTRQLSG